MQFSAFFNILKYRDVPITHPSFWYSFCGTNFELNRLSSHLTNNGQKVKIMEFNENWVGWPTNRWDWSCTIYLAWSHRNSIGQATLISLLQLRTNFISEWYGKGLCQSINERFTTKKRRKNCLGMVTVWSLDYMHNNYQNLIILLFFLISNWSEWSTPPMSWSTRPSFIKFHDFVISPIVSVMKEQSVRKYLFFS